MSQIKLLKINSQGFTEEHGSADDITFATVTGATQVAVTSGVTLTNNISFAAATDTIAGIQNQNLLDKTANETVTGTWTIDTGVKLILNDSPTLPEHAANKDYVDSVAKGLSWQHEVIDFIDFTTAEPATPNNGERYIATVTGTSSVTAQPITAEYIYEWSSAQSVWLEFQPIEGWTLYVMDLNEYYAYNNANNWVFIGNIINHNSLSGLQGGTTNEYYHITSAQSTFVGALTTKISAGGDVLANNVNDTITANYTFNGDLNVSGGSLELPTSADLTPATGGVYVDSLNNKLYAYNGTTYFDVGGSGTATSVTSTYTAGTGGISQYDIVYIDSNNTILKGDANGFSTSKVIGFAPAAISATNSGSVQENGVLSGVLSGATAGDAYFLGETAGQIVSTPPTTSGAYVVRVGYARNATDLHIQIQQIGKRA